jgi:hypothetical protein
VAGAVPYPAHNQFFECHFLGRCVYIASPCAATLHAALPLAAILPWLLSNQGIQCIPSWRSAVFVLLWALFKRVTSHFPSLITTLAHPYCTCSNAEVWTRVCADTAQIETALWRVCMPHHCPPRVTHLIMPFVSRAHTRHSRPQQCCWPEFRPCHNVQRCLSGFKSVPTVVGGLRVQHYSLIVCLASCWMVDRTMGLAILACSNCCGERQKPWLRARQFYLSTATVNMSSQAATPCGCLSSSCHVVCLSCAVLGPKLRAALGRSLFQWNQCWRPLCATDIQQGG